MTSLASSSTFLDKMSDNLKTFLDQFGLLSNGEATQSMSSFKAWTDYYKTYKGAVVNIPLTLQAILLRDGPCPAGTVNTPTGKLERILDYFAPETDSETSKYGVTFKPPHKYTPTITQAVLEAGTKIDGTLTLTYGPLIINNLLLSNFDYTISKERSRDGEPLYIAVNFSLIPALTFTKDHLPK